jgi:methylmalonyl-CoA mutase C-terminal domain/subunit
VDALRNRGLNDVLVIAGGIIPAPDAEALKKKGVAEIFPPGTPMDEITEFIRSGVSKRW